MRDPGQFGKSQAETPGPCLEAKNPSVQVPNSSNFPVSGADGRTSPTNANYFERVPVAPSRPLKNQFLAQNPPLDELVAQNAHVSREQPERVRKTLYQPKHYNFGDSLFESSSDSERARPDPREIDLDDDEVLLRAKISS